MLNFIRSAVFTALIFTFSYSYSQDTDASTGLSRYIEEIVVTARAQEDQSVRDIPVAITAFSEDAMDALGIESLDDIANTSASLEINRINSGSGVQIAVRGIASSPGSLGIEQSVAVMIDGVYFPQGRVINEGLFDTGQVAILKGPQALYFGKNATAGAIVISTNDPGDEFEFKAKISNEFEYETKTGEFVVSGPIGDNWGARLALFTSEMDKGWIRNNAQEATYTTVDAAQGFAPTTHTSPPPSGGYAPMAEINSARLTLKGDIADNVTLKIKASTTENEYSTLNTTEKYECSALNGIPHLNGADPDNPPFLKPIANPLGGLCNKDRVKGINTIPDGPAAALPITGQFGGELGEKYESQILTADLNIDLESVAIRTIINHHEQDTQWVIDCDSGPTVNCFAGEVNGFENFSIEAKILSKNEGNFNWALGGYYADIKRSFEQEVIFAGAENSAADISNRFVAYDKISGTDGETISIYGELIWDINDTLQLTAGARYIEEEKDSFFTQPYVNPVFGFLFVEGRMLEAKTSLDELVPEVTLRYQPDENITYFVAYKEGWKSAGFDNGSIDSTLNANPIADITYDPETVEGIEAGVKALLLDGTLNVEFDIYRYEYEGLQLNFFNSATFAYRTLNADETESEGFELQLQYLPPSIEGLGLTAAIGYNDANYVKFSGPCYAGQKPSEGCTTQVGGLWEQNLNGSKKGLAPELRYNLGFNYVGDIGNGLELGLVGNVKYSDEYVLRDTIPDAMQGSYHIFDANVSIASPEAGWKLSLIGRNLNDEYIQTYAADTPSSGGNAGSIYGFRGDRYAYTKPGRTLMLQLAYQR